MKTGSSAMPTSAVVFYARAFTLATLALLGFLLYLILSPFFAPLTWALFIAFMLHPLHTWTVGKLHGRENLSAALLTALTLLTLIGPFTVLVAAFVVQVTELLQYAQQIAAEHREYRDLRTVPVVGAWLAWLQTSLGLSLQQIQSGIEQGTRALLQFVAALGGKLLLGAFDMAVSFLIMMFTLYFMIRDREKFLSTLRAMIPLSSARKNRLFDHLGSVTRAVVFGSGVTALVQGILVGIGFAVLGLPSPVVFGTMAMVFALVPMVGTPIVWAPAVIVLAMQERWIAAGLLLGWGIMVSTIDNFLRPYLVAGRAEVTTLTVFIGVIGGMFAFGPVGLLLGPLVLALAIALVRFALEVRPLEITEASVATSSKARKAEKD